MQWLWRDIRYGVRELVKRLGFTLLAVLTLALGIGAVTTIYSVIQNVLLDPFPYVPDSRRFVDVLIQDKEHPSGRWRGALAVPEFLDYQEQSRVFEEVIGTVVEDELYRTGEGAERLRVALVTPNTFQFLGVAPLLGRGITLADAKPGGPPVAALSYRLWVSRFNRDAGVLGRTLVLGENTYTVIGVMPPRFTWHVADVWVPGPLDRSDAETREGYRWFQARLKPGVTLEEAEADLNLIAARLARVYPDGYPKRFTVRVITVTEFVVGRFRRVLYTLLAAVGLLLLITCCNVANMLLARATAREKEMSIRAALGAGRWRIVRQLLVESALLSLAGAAAGCLLAYGGIKAVAAAIPAGTIPWESEIALNRPVLLFSLGVAATTALLFGLAPALHSARRDVVQGLRGAGKGGAGGFRHGRLRNALVVAEVALSLVLLAGAGLLMRTFIAIVQVDPGFRTENLLVARPAFAPKQDRSASEKRRFFRQVLQRVSALPGVVAAAETTALPPFGAMQTEVDIPGKTHTERWDSVLQLSSAGYFRTLGVRFLSGRPFSEAEADGARRVAVVNQTFVRRYFGHEDPIGRQVAFKWLATVPDAVQNPVFEIVGVVADTRNEGLQNPPAPEVIVPSTVTGVGGRNLIVRTAMDAASLLKAVQREVWAVDRNVALTRTGTIEEFLRSYSYAQPRFSLFVLGVFAAVGLALVGTGVYSVVAYTVSRQTHEIGIRMALGADRRAVLRVVLGMGARMIGAGIAAGLLASFAATRLIAGQLWNVSPRDPATLAAAVCVITVMGLAACCVPALRATRVDPMAALRHE